MIRVTHLGVTTNLPENILLINILRSMPPQLIERIVLQSLKGMEELRTLPPTFIPEITISSIVNPNGGPLGR